MEFEMERYLQHEHSNFFLLLDISQFMEHSQQFFCYPEHKFTLIVRLFPHICVLVNKFVGGIYEKWN